MLVVFLLFFFVVVVFFLFVCFFYTLYVFVWIQQGCLANTVFALDPSNIVINRVLCIQVIIDCTICSGSFNFN